MATITKNFKIRITDVENLSSSFVTEQNVKKRLAEIIYTEDPTADAVKISYVASKEATPKTVLSIADRSDRMFPNSKNNKTQEFIGYINSAAVSVQNKNFYITQEFIENSVKDIPLYFKVILPSDTVTESVKIFNSSFENIGSDKYKVVKEYIRNEVTGVPTEEIESILVFNSLENTFDYNTGEYELYYIQYTNSSNETFTNLLNNVLAYTEAKFSDFWEISPGTLKPWKRVYLFSSGIDSVNDYIVSLSSASKYAVRYKEFNRIKIIPPVDFFDNGPWFPRIYNGGFTYSYYGYNSKYDIPEYSLQSFNPIEPYKLAARASSVKVTDYIIKLPHENIITDSIYSKLYLQLEEDGEIKYAITNDLSKVGTYVLDSSGNKVADEDGNILLWSNEYLSSIDNLSGIIQLSQRVLDSYDIYATYTYKEDYYTLSTLFLNPLLNRDVLNSIYVIYLVPKNIKNHKHKSGSQVSSIQWIKVSKNGIIEETSQSIETGNPNLDRAAIISTGGYGISGVLGIHYSWRASCSIQEESSIVPVVPGLVISVDSTIGFPRSGWIRVLDIDRKYRYIKYVDKDSNSITLSSNTTEATSFYTLNEDTIQLVNFVDKYTNLSSNNGEDELLYSGLPNNLPSIFAQYFILGEISINPPQQTNSLSVIDVRENGGGIIESKYDEAKQFNPEVQWINDNGNYNGQPFPGRSSLVYELPISLKEEFSLDQIKSIVTSYTPVGVFPIIQFYGYEPRIISIVPSTSSVIVEWEKEGEEFVYDIWYSTSGTNKFIKANTSRIVDGSGDTNIFTINGLTTGKSYIIKITMQDKYYQWWYSYSSPSSIDGGLGLEESAPVYPFGNTANFSLYIGE